MITIIAGDRGFHDYQECCRYIKEIGVDISLVYTTGAHVPNTFGEWWARENNIPHQKFPRKMIPYMVSSAEDIIYFKRKKTEPHMLKLAHEGGLEIYEYEF